MAAVSKSDREPDLIGDFSMAHALPLINGKHQDLKSISPETLVDLMNGHYSQVIGGYAIVDCRYPYEYEGGHISGAINIFSTEALIEKFFSENRGTNHLIVPPPTPKIDSDCMVLGTSSAFGTSSFGTTSTMIQSGTESSSLEVVKRTALIFHCEFSSKRGPKIVSNVELPSFPLFGDCIKNSDFHCIKNSDCVKNSDCIKNSDCDLIVLLLGTDSFGPRIGKQIKPVIQG